MSCSALRVPVFGILYLELGVVRKVAIVLPELHLGFPLMGDRLVLGARQAMNLLGET